MQGGLGWHKGYFFRTLNEQDDLSTWGNYGEMDFWREERLWSVLQQWY